MLYERVNDLIKTKITEHFITAYNKTVFIIEAYSHIFIERTIHHNICTFNYTNLLIAYINDFYIKY